MEVCPAPRPPPPPPQQNLSPPTPFADTSADCCFTKPGVPGGRMGEVEAREKKEVVLTTNLADPSPFPSPHSQAAGESHDFLEPSNLLFPEDDRTGSLKKERIAKSNHEKWCFSTLPRKVGGDKENGEAATTRTKTPQLDSVEPGAKIPKSRSTSDNISLGLLESHLVLPPPPSFKSVHFAPGVEEEPGSPTIPTEVTTACSPHY